MSSDPSKISGKFNATVGEMKEGLGKIIQSKSLQSSGREQSQAGSDEVEAAIEHKEGRQNKLGGIKDSTIGAVTGNKEKQTQGNLRHDMGRAQRDPNSTARTQGYKEPSGAQGQLGGTKDSTLGAGTGHRQQQTHGNLQHDMGSAQQNPNSAARAHEYREGDQGQFGGVKDPALGAVTGDRQQQTHGNLQHDMGIAQHQQNPNSAARALGHNEGDQGQFGGMKDSTLGAVTGDKQQQTHGNLQRDMGIAQHQQNPNSAARALGHNEGDQGQFGGIKDSTLGAVTGDRQQQTHGNLQREMGSDQPDPDSIARAQGYKEGDRGQFAGMKDPALGAVTGDRQQQTQGNLQRDMDSAQHQQDLKSTAHAQGYNAGAQDQLGGMKDSTLGGITGDKQQQTQGILRRDKDFNSSPDKY